MVLTIKATEITTSAGDGETFRARMEMIEWLFLDRVDSQRTGLAIDLADKYAIKIPATTTKPRLAIGNMTMVQTKQALNPPPV
jgi:hypothetical protein